MSIPGIMLADSERLYTDCLKLLLEEEKEYKIVAVCNKEADLLSFINKYKSELLILDASITENCTGLLKRIYELNSNQKVLVLSSAKDANFLFGLYKVGIAGFVLKASGAKTLKKAVSVILTGSQYIEPVMIPALKDIIDKNEAGVETDGFLSKRELEVLKLVSKGLFNKEIAFNLGIKETTVKSHITNLFKKTGVTDRTQLAVYAFKNGYSDME